jgi:outer membrane protein OmpA-like peptidoglycan-associated protein
MRQLLRVLAVLLLAGTGAAVAQDPNRAPAPTAGEGAIPITYVGSNGRIGLGFTDDGDASGEFLAVFGADGRSAWLAEGWFGRGGAGGLKLARHWLLGGATREDTIERPDAVRVAKGFLAVDRNPFDDRKATLGFGLERERWFAEGYLSAGLTDERLVDTRVVVERSTITGVTPGGRPFTQQRTLTTTTRGFEKAYDRGVGGRLGRYLDDAALRLRGGLDHEWGDFGSRQTTLSLGLEKFLPGSGSSLALTVETLRRNGDFARDERDTRAWLWWRYDFGGAGAWRPVEPYREVEVREEVAAREPEPVVIRNEVGMDAAAFFELDRFALRDGDRAELAAIVDAILSDRRVSRIAVVGHTCDLGPEAYNQRLSERRARAVADFLVAQGVPEAEIDLRGAGESEPRFPNDGPANRARNRRVDVSFLTVEERVEPGEPAPPEVRIRWTREPVAVPAAWIERALRNPVAHKRTVDVYRIESAETVETLGPQVLVNRPPVAVDDLATVPRNSPGVAIPVLANDSDPDGDALTIVAVTTPANGSATIAGAAIRYVPRTGFVGADSFTYTISDGALTATATVRITVAAQAPVANPDRATTRRNQPVTIDVLANDTDPAGDTLTLVAVANPAHGSVSFSAAGRVTYTPRPGFAGNDGFTYRIRNGAGLEAEGRVDVTVVADPPVANPDSATTPFATPVTVNVLANDSDPADDVLTLVAAEGAANGTVSFTPDGRVTYRPAATFFGTEVLRYRIRNNAGLEASSTLTITVAAPLPPIAVDDEGIVPGAYDLVPIVIAVLANDSDPQGLALTVIAASNPIRGSAEILPDGTVRYTPRASFCGADAFTYTIRNAAGLTASARVVIRRQFTAGSAAIAKSCPI